MNIAKNKQTQLTHSIERPVYDKKKLKRETPLGHFVKHFERLYIHKYEAYLITIIYRGVPGAVVDNYSGARRSGVHEKERKGSVRVENGSATEIQERV